jgi:hypothetical protein
MLVPYFSQTCFIFSIEIENNEYIEKIDIEHYFSKN